MSFNVISENKILVYSNIGIYLPKTLSVYGSKIFERKIVIIFLPINSSISFGCSKEPSH